MSVTTAALSAPPSQTAADVPTVIPPIATSGSAPIAARQARSLSGVWGAHFMALRTVGQIGPSAT